MEKLIRKGQTKALVSLEMKISGILSIARETIFIFNINVFIVLHDVR